MLMTVLTVCLAAKGALPGMWIFIIFTFYAFLYHALPHIRGPAMFDKAVRLNLYVPLFSLFVLSVRSVPFILSDTTVLQAGPIPVSSFIRAECHHKPVMHHDDAFPVFSVLSRSSVGAISLFITQSGVAIECTVP